MMTTTPTPASPPATELPEDRSRRAVVVIGRNEGARLVRCLDSLAEQGALLVYVDSGSTDNSLDVTTCSTLAAVLAYYLLGRLPFFAHRPALRPASTAPLQSDAPGPPVEAPPLPAAEEAALAVESRAASIFRRLLVLAVVGLFLFAVARDFGATLSSEG